MLCVLAPSAAASRDKLCPVGSRCLAAIEHRASGIAFRATALFGESARSGGEDCVHRIAGLVWLRTFSSVPSFQTALTNNVSTCNDPLSCRHHTANLLSR